MNVPKMRRALKLALEALDEDETAPPAEESKPARKVSPIAERRAVKALARLGVDLEDDE